MLVWKDVAQMEGHGKKSRRRSFGKMWMERLDWKFTSIRWQWLKKEKISLECLLWNFAERSWTLYLIYFFNKYIANSYD